MRCITPCLHEIMEGLTSRRRYGWPKSTVHLMSALARLVERLRWLLICFLNRCISLITEIALIRRSLLDIWRVQPVLRGDARMLGVPNFAGLAY